MHAYQSGSPRSCWPVIFRKSQISGRNPHKAEYWQSEGLNHSDWYVDLIEGPAFTCATCKHSWALISKTFPQREQRIASHWSNYTLKYYKGARLNSSIPRRSLGKCLFVSLFRRLRTSFLGRQPGMVQYVDHVWTLYLGIVWHIRSPQISPNSSSHQLTPKVFSLFLFPTLAKVW